MFVIITSIIIFIGLFIYLGLTNVKTYKLVAKNEMGNTILEGFDEEAVAIKMKNYTKSYGTKLTMEKVENGTERVWKLNAKQYLALLSFTFILFGCFQNIPANTVGVAFNPFKGGVQDNILQEGFKTKSPFETVYILSTEITEITFDDVSVQTGDSQWLKTKLQIQVQLDKTKTFEYFKKYRDKKLKDISNVLRTTTQRELEALTTKYNVMEILGDKRSAVMNETLTLLQKEFIKDGIVLQRLVLVDTDAGDTIESAISKEAAAKKEAETAKYLKEKAELEGAAKVIEAQKQKEANDLLSKSLTKEILTEQYISKWNGQLPKVVSDGSNIFDVTSLLGEEK